MQISIYVYFTLSHLFCILYYGSWYIGGFDCFIIKMCQYFYLGFYHSFIFFSFFKKNFIYFSWRLITLQYCSGFCHTLIWISHGLHVSPSQTPLQILLRKSCFSFVLCAVHMYFNLALLEFTYLFVYSFITIPLIHLSYILNESLSEELV